MNDWSSYARPAGFFAGALVILVAVTPLLAQTTDATTEITETPTEAQLGFSIYPSSVFLTSYDAGRGQRYYIFGTDSTFDQMVRYYSVVLDERGDRVFTAPATHVFEVGRFREETMSFPPGVTIKDYTWNGSEGYLDPRPGSRERYPTVIQIVPPPAGQAER